MMLHWVELENWRKHKKTRIDFAENTTIVYGPNEKGKSTILEALSRGFFDKPSSNNQDIKRIKPLTASGNVASTVKIEFTINNTRYRIEKTFNLRASTDLYRIGKDGPVLRDQDKSAEKMIIELLEADLPTGISKPAQWGAFQWLWALQANRKLPSGNDDNDPTKTLHLENETGGIIVTPKFQAVQSRLKTPYSKYFDKKGKRKTRGKSPILELEKEIENLRIKREKLIEEIDYADEQKTRLNELQSRLPEMERMKKETEEKLEKAKNDVVGFSDTESKLEIANAAVREAERDFKDADEALTEHANIKNEIKILLDKEKDTNENFFRLEALRDQLNEDLNQNEKQIDELGNKLKNCDELVRDARILYTKSTTLERINELNKKIDRIKKIDDEILTLKKRELPIFPTNDEIDEFIQNHISILSLEKELKKIGLSVEINHGEKGSLDIEVDGNKILEESVIKGAEIVSVGAHDLGKVTVKAKLDQASDNKVEIDLMKEKNRAILHKYDIKSIDQLKKVNKEQLLIKQEIDQLVKSRKWFDERPQNEISLELIDLGKKIDRYEGMDRTPISIEQNSPDVDLGNQMNIREDEQTNARNLLNKARKNRDTLKEKISKTNEKLIGAESNKEHYSKELDNARNKQDQLFNKYGSIENQEKALETAKFNYNDKKAKLNELKKKYEDLEKGPMNKINRLQTELKNREKIIQQQQSSIDNLNGSINEASSYGAYSKLADTDSKIEISLERLKKENLRAESYKLLTEILDQKYRSVMAEVIDPIKDEIKSSLTYVTGSLHEDIELDQYLYPKKLSERGFDNETALDFEEGSSGLKELLTLCVRLAVAKHLSERDSQCLILDDPFVHVSSDRLNKMIELLNSAIKEYGLQIVVLTHRPMELAGFEGKLVDIENQI